MSDVVPRIVEFLNWTTPPPSVVLTPMPDCSLGLCQSKANIPVLGSVLVSVGGGGAGTGSVPLTGGVVVVVVVVVVVLSGGVGGGV